MSPFQIRTVYHWSPRKNRKEILHSGLKIMMSTIEYENPVTGKMEVWEPSYICTSPDSWTALKYVLPMFEEFDPPELDLFQVELTGRDHVKIRNDETAKVLEVRVCNSIPPDRVCYIATRRPPGAVFIIGGRHERDGTRKILWKAS